jgi:hypothetical protein
MIESNIDFLNGLFIIFSEWHKKPFINTKLVPLYVPWHMPR